jgi:hypothetical protein
LSDLFVVYSRAGNQRRTLLNFGDQFDNVWEAPLDSQLVIKLRYRLGT